MKNNYSMFIGRTTRLPLVGTLAKNGSWNAKRLKLNTKSFFNHLTSIYF